MNTVCLLSPFMVIFFFHWHSFVHVLLPEWLWLSYVFGFARYQLDKVWTLDLSAQTLHTA